MPSLKQRIEAAAHEFVAGVLELLRTAPLGEVMELMASAPREGRRRALGPPISPSIRPSLSPPLSPPILLPSKQTSRKEAGKGAAKPTRPARSRLAPARRLDAHEDAPPPPGDFDVTTPELLLVGEPAAATAERRMPAILEPPTAAPASALEPPPPEPVRPEATLRPGESVARSNGAGIVIRRTKHTKNRA